VATSLRARRPASNHGDFGINEKSPDKRSGQQDSGRNEERSNPQSFLDEKPEDDGRNRRSQTSRRVHDAGDRTAVLSADIHGNRPSGADHKLEEEERCSQTKDGGGRMQGSCCREQTGRGREHSGSRYDAPRKLEAVSFPVYAIGQSASHKIADHTGQEGQGSKGTYRS